MRHQNLSDGCGRTADHPASLIAFLINAGTVGRTGDRLNFIFLNANSFSQTWSGMVDLSLRNTHLEPRLTKQTCSAKGNFGAWVKV
jgi:hypothetical protein